jgi:hypothetical protein
MALEVLVDRARRYVNVVDLQEIGDALSADAAGAQKANVGIESANL